MKKNANNSKKNLKRARQSVGLRASKAAYKMAAEELVMVEAGSEVDRALLLLRKKIRERGFTQLEVQESLKWGRSYISQLLTKQKALRLEQVLLILGVIGVEPGDFFEELYPAAGGRWGNPSAFRLFPGIEEPSRFRVPEASSSVKELRSMIRGLVGLLIDRHVIRIDDLTVAVHAAEDGYA